MAWKIVEGEIEYKGFRCELQVFGYIPCQRNPGRKNNGF